MDAKEHILVGEYLLESGKVQPEDIQEALVVQTVHNARGQSALIGDILIEMGVVDREDILLALAQQEFARMGLVVA